MSKQNLYSLVEMNILERIWKYEKTPVYLCSDLKVRYQRNDEIVEDSGNK